MKIECVKEKIYLAVSKAEKIVSKNINLPVLSCLLLETKGNNLIIKSTNLDLGLEISIPVKVEEQGKVAIPASVFVNFLNNLNDNKNIFIETNENTLKISSQKSSATIKTLSFDDFPTIPKINDEKTFKIQSKDLINGIKSVIYSASLSGVKPELSSVFIYTQEENMIFVATDSFRLAEKTIKIKKNIEINSILIPFKNASDIIKIIDNTDEEIEISSNKNQISFNFSGIYLVSRVIDGVFPDYKNILPKEVKTKVVLLKQDLIDALKISNIFSDNFNQLNVSVKKGEKDIKIKTRNNDIGENTNQIDSIIEGEDIEVNFNYRYITDCLNSINSDSISLSFDGMNKPLVIRGLTDKTFTYLVMPMNR